MVASKQHPRKVSHSGASSQHRSRRRPSLRTSPTQKRSKSVSAVVPVQQQESRRPSAPIVTELPRLSIADRFMATNYTAPPPTPLAKKSPSASTTSNSLKSDSTQLSVADRFMSAASPTISLQSIQKYRGRSASASSSSKLQSKKDPEPGRLTIADAFMKSSASSPTTRSRAASFADELEYVRKPSQGKKKKKKEDFYGISVLK